MSFCFDDISFHDQCYSSAHCSRYITNAAENIFPLNKSLVTPSNTGQEINSPFSYTQGLKEFRMGLMEISSQTYNKRYTLSLFRFLLLWFTWEPVFVMEFCANQLRMDSFLPVLSQFHVTLFPNMRPSNILCLDKIFFY